MTRLILGALLFLMVSCKPCDTLFLDLDLLSVLPQDGIYLMEGFGPVQQLECQPGLSREGLMPSSKLMFFSKRESELKFVVQTSEPHDHLTLSLEINGFMVHSSLPGVGETVVPFRAQKGLNVIVVKYKITTLDDTGVAGRPVVVFNKFEVRSDIRG